MYHLFNYTSNFATLVAYGVTCDLLQGQGQGYSRCWRSVCAANVTHQRWVGTATGVASLVMNTVTAKTTWTDESNFVTRNKKLQKSFFMLSAKMRINHL